MSVILPIPIGEVEQQQEQPSLTYRLDLDRGRIVGMVDGLEAVNQAIRKHLITPRFRCLIYDNQYGSEIKETIIAGDASPEYIEAEMPRIVRDALSIDSRILDVYDFSYSFDGEEAFIRFRASTIFGETVIEEVI
nr:MAG TPA: Protein of unknown function (DUF2634) [Caudoviricetes sp.]